MVAHSVAVLVLELRATSGAAVPDKLGKVVAINLGGGTNKSNLRRSFCDRTLTCLNRLGATTENPIERGAGGWIGARSSHPQRHRCPLVAG